MSDYVRAKLPGGFYFLTVTPFDRRKFSTLTLARRILRQVWEEVEESIHSELRQFVCFMTTCTLFGVYHQTIVIIPNAGG